MRQRRRVAPLLALTGHRAARVVGPARRHACSVYGVDARFFAFHGVDGDGAARIGRAGSARISPPNSAPPSGDALVVRVARPTDIPLDSLHGRRERCGPVDSPDGAGRARAREQMGEFSLAPGQGPVRAVFVPLARLQRDLGIAGRVNTSARRRRPGSAADTRRRRARAVGLHSTVDDLGLHVQTSPRPERTVIVESTSGLIPDAIATPSSASAAAPVACGDAGADVAGERA